MLSKHLDSLELDSLFLLHNLQVYEPLPRPQVSPKDTQRDPGRREERGMSHKRERSAVDKERELVRDGSRSRRRCREGWQMEKDEEWGAWERQKDEGEKKWRGRETQTQ